MDDNILLVDDEPAVLRALDRVLTPAGFEVFSAEDGWAALDILAREKIDIVISDMRMPKMSGHQFLRRVKESYPATVRLILSGYTDEKEIVRSMLDGSARLYILKPWDNRQLIKTVQQLLTVKRRLQDSNLLPVINQIEGLRALPRIYQKLMELIERDADMRQIASIIEEDPPTAATVLHIANSAFYGVRTGSISQALSYLGLTTLRGIVLSTSCTGAGEEVGGRGGVSERLWQQACLANRLVSGLHHRLLGRHIPDAAATAGLLFDIGRLLIMRQFPAQYARILAEAASRPTDSIQAIEREVLGVSHHEIGGYLLDWWDLPQPVVECAVFHDDPLADGVIDQQLACIVHIAAHYAASSLGVLSETLNPAAFTRLGTDQVVCEKYIAEILDK